MLHCCSLMVQTISILLTDRCVSLSWLPSNCSSKRECSQNMNCTDTQNNTSSLMYTVYSQASTGGFCSSVSFLWYFHRVTDSWWTTATVLLLCDWCFGRVNIRPFLQLFKLKGVSVENKQFCLYGWADDKSPLTWWERPIATCST